METVIADAGPLVAYLKRDDKDHAWTKEVFQRLTAPLLTCDAALSEAFFLLQQTHGGTGRLIELLENGLVVPAFDLAAELPAVGQLLRKYESVPMSLADACLVRMAEVHRDAAVFTLDGDFQVYRKHRRQIIPLIIPE
jgi:predicted nucleic acid-binding protein